MIRSFKDKDTQQVFEQKRSKKLPPDIQYRALVKLLLVDSAEVIGDLRMPPANYLEKLHGTRSDDYSIRINRQWRICFKFRDGDAYDVGIEDYR